MNIKRAFVLGLCFISFCSLVSALEDCSNSGCDNEAASSSVGACVSTEHYSCDSFNNDQTKCELNGRLQQTPGGTPFGVKIVKGDFPTLCVQNQAGKNCNEPLAPCSADAICKYENGQCSFDHVWGDWTSKKKRTTCACREE